MQGFEAVLQNRRKKCMIWYTAVLKSVLQFNEGLCEVFGCWKSVCFNVLLFLHRFLSSNFVVLPTIPLERVLVRASGAENMDTWRFAVTSCLSNYSFISRVLKLWNKQPPMLIVDKSSRCRQPIRGSRMCLVCLEERWKNFRVFGRPF